MSYDSIPNGAIKLKGSENIYRIRQGDYEIVNEIESTVLHIIIIRIRHRKNIYKK
ncbi:MAG: type II toxin-antitoxin system RelE/ParE family toxin [Candidatus Heimdallarchaeota archaeon]|nr:type II toxin-antitoxin system RelE/ParE family toxin [Candidatus Heimdallarchaeota archaeon]